MGCGARSGYCGNQLRIDSASAVESTAVNATNKTRREQEWSTAIKVSAVACRTIAGHLLSFALAASACQFESCWLLQCVGSGCCVVVDCDVFLIRGREKPFVLRKVSDVTNMQSAQHCARWELRQYCVVEPSLLF